MSDGAAADFRTICLDETTPLCGVQIKRAFDMKNAEPVSRFWTYAIVLVTSLLVALLSLPFAPVGSLGDANPDIRLVDSDSSGSKGKPRGPS